MSEKELIKSWDSAWNRVIVAQLAPTALLITTVALLQFGLDHANLAVRWAALFILLASGILGALAEFSAATEAIAVASELDKIKGASRQARSIVGLARWLPVVQYVTPAIFILIFVFLAAALLHG